MRDLVARGSIVIGAAVYVVLLTVYYIYLVSPWYAYAGYLHNPPATYLPVVLGGALAVAPARWMPIRLERPSHVVLWFLYVLVYVPTCVVPFYALGTDPWVLFGRLCWLFLAMELLGLSYRLPELRLPDFRLSGFMFWLSIGVVSAACYALIGVTFGFRLRLVSLAEVYFVRSEYRLALTGAGPLVPYAISWVGNVLNPLFMAQGLLRRNPLLLLAGVVGQAWVFSITGFRTVAFSIALVVALLFVLRHKGRRFGFYVMWGSVALIVVPWLIDRVLGFWFLSFLLARRIEVVPGLLTGFYMDFFSSNPHTFLSDSIFRAIVDFPYSMSVPNTIGYTYMGSPETWANANVWADAFANFGFPGIITMTVLLGLFLWVFDSVAEKRDFRTATLLLGVPAFTLSNTGLLTSLLTHGVAFALLVLYVMPSHTRDIRLGWRQAERESVPSADDSPADD